jgi:hypothetical protein
MRKRLIWAFLAVASLLAVPTLAGANGGSSAAADHTVKLSGLRDALWTNSPAGLDFTFPGNKGIITGTASGTIGGQPTGQGVFYEKWTATSKPSMAKTHGAYLFPNGSISFRGHTVKNTSSSYLVAVTVTGGTGAYGNASGKFTISGKPHHFQGEKDVSTNNVTGILRY